MSKVMGIVVPPDAIRQTEHGLVVLVPLADVLGYVEMMAPGEGGAVVRVSRPLVLLGAFAESRAAQLVELGRALGGARIYGPGEEGGLPPLPALRRDGEPA